MQYTKTFIIISGDFNHAILDSTLAAFHQETTRQLAYCMLTGWHIPTWFTYMATVPTSGPMAASNYSMRSIRKWSPEMECAMRDCCDTPDWDVLLDLHGRRGDDTLFSGLSQLLCRCGLSH